ncbi:MAG: single-stranded-DNA-specific exonuclease RecJ [Phycisphaerales bacterium]|jgi:single-stranded-DNA-specific exonuclease|nr:single-stranded-DNA-specific exonuclease RecJ [Phycisphaerales bacterium]
MQGLTKRWETPEAANPTLSIAERILDSRGYSNSEERITFLDPKLSNLEDPCELPNAEKAASVLCSALLEGKKVLIFGDYDADGITASAVLYHVISAATGKDGPTIYIPNRVDEGYGIRPEAMEKFSSAGIDLVVSVDCGITAIEAAIKAKELGITLIITDHHKQRDDGKLPDCAAIVHPGIDTEPKTLFAGVGVSYQLAWAFAREWSGSRMVNEKLKKTLLDVLPLVAIGTIADMVPLISGNRILARWGLQLLPSSANPGLRAIMDELDTPSKKLNSSHISFGIAPLINAVGRLSHAATAVDLLTHLDGELAKAAAGELSEHNRNRRKVQRQIVDEALEQIKENQLTNQSVIILQNNSWNRGVVGVAAGKCIETHYRPTILLSGEEDELVGSARSISGFSIFDALCFCKEYLEQFGGHDMAAGLSIKRKNFDLFVEAMTEYANKNISPEQLVPSIKPDIVADLSEITHTAAVEVEKLGPFGIGNKTPIIQIMSVKVDDAKAIGGEGRHLSLWIGSGTQRVRCVWWGNGNKCDLLSRGMIIDVVGRLKINEFRGYKSAELDLLDISLPST